MVKKTGIVYLPVKESLKPFSKPKLNKPPVSARGILGSTLDGFFLLF